MILYVYTSLGSVLLFRHVPHHFRHNNEGLFWRFNYTGTLILTKGQVTAKICSLLRVFVTSRFFFVWSPKISLYFTMTAKAKKTRPTPYQPRHESKGLHNLMKVSLNNLPLNNLIHWRLHQQLHHNRSCCWELELRHQIQPSLWLSLLPWSVDCPCCC